MYKALILEDEEPAMRVLVHALKAYPELTIVEQCVDLGAARKALRLHEPDIVFLDIEVEGQKVFPLVEELWRNGQTPSIIFVTAWGKKYLEEATASCEQLFQWSYLMKPVRDKKLGELIRRFRAVRERRSGEADRLVIRSGSKEFFLPFEEVVYCESDGNYVNVYQLADKQLMKRVLPGSLSSFLKEELTTPDVVRISSKHAINRKYLKGSAERRAICVLDRKDLPEEVRLRVPENRRKRVWEELLG